MPLVPRKTLYVFVYYRVTSQVAKGLTKCDPDIYYMMIQDCTADRIQAVLASTLYPLIKTSRPDMEQGTWPVPRLPV